MSDGMYMFIHVHTIGMSDGMYMFIHVHTMSGNSEWEQLQNVIQ